MFPAVAALSEKSSSEWMKLILTELQSRNESVHFLQVGACDGAWEHTNDPLQKAMMTASNFQGMMIEPVPELFTKLKSAIGEDEELKNRIQPLNAAVSGDHDGTLPFYMVDPDKLGADKPNAPHWMRYQLGSFDEGHIEKHLKGVKELQAKGWKHYVRKFMVKSLTPETLLQRYWESRADVDDEEHKIHILMIDAEGFDGKVVQAFMALRGMRPNIVIYERKHLQEDEAQECEAMLKGIGYLVGRGGGNVVAVKIELKGVL